MSPDEPRSALTVAEPACNPGGIIVLALFVRHLPISQCIRIFEDLVQQVFQRPTPKSLFGRLRYCVDSWLADGCYNAGVLDTFLQAYMGAASRMFDHHPGMRATKVGVTATTIEDPSPIVFTNYNGLAGRSEDAGTTACLNLATPANSNEHTGITGQRTLIMSLLCGKCKPIVLLRWPAAD